MGLDSESAKRAVGKRWAGRPIVKCPACGKEHRCRTTLRELMAEGVVTLASEVPAAMRGLSKEEKGVVAGVEPQPSTTVAVPKVKKHGCVQHRVHQPGCDYCEL